MMNGICFRNCFWFLVITLFASLFICLAGCGMASHSKRILATVDNDPIMEEDLRYALNISHRREDLSSAGSMNLSQFIQKMVDDRLIIHEAVNSGMDRYPEVQQAVKAFVQRESVVKLHDEEIVKKVSVTDKEIKDYYRKNYEQFTMGIIETESGEEAGELYVRLQKGESFGDLAGRYSIHPSKENKGVIHIIKGSIPVDFQKIILDLKPGEISSVMKVADGYYIVKLFDSKEAADEEMDKVKKSIEKVIRKLMEQERSDEYLKSLRNQADIKIEKELLSAIKGEAYKDESKNRADDRRPLATVNGSVFTVSDYASAVKSSRGISGDDNVNLWIDRILIDREALSRNYEKVPDFRKKVSCYENQLLKETFIKRVIVSKIKITEDTMKDYYLKNQKSYLKPVRFKIQQITVKTEEEAGEIMNSVVNGADFSWVAKRKSVDPLASKGGDAGWVTKGELSEPLKNLVDTLTVGEISPAVKVDSYYSIIRLKEKSAEDVEEFEKVKNIIHRECFNEQLSGFLNKYINELKKDAKITFYEEEIRSLEEQFKK